MRWNKRFDGSIDSIKDKSHRPLSKHPNSHTDTEIYWIKNLIRRNPNISLIELCAKLKLNKGYKVERSNRNDNERFYSNLSFYSYGDLIVQMKKYLYKSNRLPMQTLNWLSLIEKCKELLELKEN